MTDATDCAAVVLAIIHLRGAQTITCPCDRCALARSIIGAPPPAEIVSPIGMIARGGGGPSELELRIARERRAARAALGRGPYGWVLGWTPPSQLKRRAR